MIFKLVGQVGLSKNNIRGQKDRSYKRICRNTPESGIKCVWLNARSIINKKTELYIMIDDIQPHIIGITEPWANNYMTDAELGLAGYVMFRTYRMGRRGGGLLIHCTSSKLYQRISTYKFERENVRTGRRIAPKFGTHVPIDTLTLIG